MNRKLRIAILTEYENIPNWSCQMISKINQSQSSEVVLLIKDTPIKISKNRRHYVFNLYKKLDRKYFKTSPDAFELNNISSLLNVKVVDVQDVQEIKAFDIDVVVNLKTETLQGEILNVANFGIWSFYFGDKKNSSAKPNLFWEVMNREGEVGMTLQIQSKNGIQILDTSKSLTDNLSVARSQQSYLWKAASMLPRNIEKLHRLGEATYFNRVRELNKHPMFYSNKRRPIPSNGVAIPRLIKFNWKRFTNIVRGFFYFDQWILLFHFEKTSKISYDFSKFKKLLPPKDRFWADPHVIKRNDVYYIFIEELIYKENKGFISVIEMNPDGSYKDPVKILETAYHLSFPFILEDNDEIYMIPESKQSNNIQLYKCIEFPYKWELETVLIDNIKAVDTVITKKDGKYWLFTNTIENEGASLYDELCLFYSDKLISTNWNRHPENPIVSDVKNARLAGKLFSHKNKLYRPSQNCSNHYGYGMHINEVVALNENDYKEKIVDAIYPNWDDKIISTHSLSNCNKLTVIDAQLTRHKWNYATK